MIFPSVVSIIVMIGLGGGVREGACGTFFKSALATSWYFLATMRDIERAQIGHIHPKVGCLEYSWFGLVLHFLLLDTWAG
jgi:hypothetical protein